MTKILTLEDYDRLQARVAELEAEVEANICAMDAARMEIRRLRDIVYAVCNFLDIALGNSPTRGTEILADKTQIMVAMTRLFHERARVAVMDTEIERVK